jgi:nucleotide-binding universal stress UspA family protein
MLSIRTILHPTDFTARSDCAFQLACALARAQGAQVVVLHVAAPLPPVVTPGGVITDPAYGDYEQGVCQRLCELRAPDPQVGVEHRLAEGEPATEILKVAQEVNADLIVMGTHGRTGIGRLLLGSVAEQVLRKALCPVLTVKASVPDQRPTATAGAERTPKAGSAADF